MWSSCDVNTFILIQQEESQKSQKCYWCKIQYKRSCADMNAVTYSAVRFGLPSFHGFVTHLHDNSGTSSPSDSLWSPPAGKTIFPLSCVSHSSFLTNNMNSFSHQFCLMDVWGSSNLECEDISHFLWSRLDPWTDHCGVCTGSLDHLPVAMENSKCLLQILPVKLS